jgi:hypothetical protein
LAVVDAAFGEVVPTSKRTLGWGKERGQIGLRSQQAGVSDVGLFWHGSGYAFTWPYWIFLK